MSLRTLKIVCVLSILLNIFMFGAGLGWAAWLHARHPQTNGGSIRFAGAELSPEQRRAFRGALRDARMEMQPSVAAGRQARQQAAELLHAPTLDQAALDAALARIRAADFAIRSHVEARASSFAATLAPADRARLADGIVRRPAPMRRR